MAKLNEQVLKAGTAVYHWSVMRQPRWTRGRIHGPTLLGLAILVRPAESSRRELLLEFEIVRGRHGDMPQHQRFPIRDDRLIQAIGAAREAGWDPESRGKRFVHEAGPLQPR